MIKLLYITVNPKRDGKLSKGMQIGEVFLEAFKKEIPDVEIAQMHLYDMEIPEIDMDLMYARAKLSFMGQTFDQLSKAEQTKITKMHTLADQFIDADYYVFVTPLWNLGSPAILKSFLDNLFIVGKTFNNTKDGPKGLLTGRKAIHIQTRGGIYSTGPMADLEFGDRFLTTALGFLGLEMMDSIIAEGTDYNPKQVPEIMARAKQEAMEKAKAMAKETAIISN
ncbi:FMN-dependent NADH-azoreductase [Bacillus salipaludis]|uniref:FMN dependent NADH:quinone oxidoreductase n=1 Tax=Bacillus salipaludis TaxID=2547811 RepID=A0AA90R2Q8_9BACI|nr:NAD(P)H-dependent oxidoreductase [Bacillus salipaludis]MDQ6600247.1 NAD(P)H-dependent oxidoreductase [Bacillus salipaludis]